MGMRGLLLFAAALAAAGQPRVRPVFVAGGFDSPVDIQTPRDGTWRLFVVEQGGRIKVIQDGEVLATPFLDITPKVRSGGERGLLGLGFPPGFAEKKHFYVNYTEGRGAPDLRTVVARYRVSADDPNRADPASEERILVVDQPFDNHNGGQLAFGPDGYLYAGLGDGGGANDPLRAAQNPQMLLGKMLRIDVESGAKPYAIPPGNPFAQGGGRPEIWALGLRNPWRYSFDRATGDLYIADVGQNRREEIDFEPAGSAGGANYGWPAVEGTLCNTPGCNLAAYMAPVFDYTQNGAQSVTGGYVYRGEAHTSWQGAYFFADYISGRFWSLKRGGAGWEGGEILRLEGWNVSTFGEDEGGEIYFARHRPQGRGEIWRLADERPVTKPRLIVNSASGEAGAAPGSRLNIYGWGVSNEAGGRHAEGLTAEEVSGVRVWFDEIAAGVISVLNFGGREGVVVQAPLAIAGRGTVKVVIERSGNRGEAVEVEVRPAHPALYAGLVPEAVAGGEAALLGTGLGEVDGEGRCALAVETRIGERTAETKYCRASLDMAGVYEIGVRLPEGVAGKVPVTISAGGVESPAVLMRVR
jgi:uncharacterized protein (TIGR03437 family)